MRRLASIVALVAAILGPVGAYASPRDHGRGAPYPERPYGGGWGRRGPSAAGPARAPWTALPPAPPWGRGRAGGYFPAARWRGRGTIVPYPGLGWARPAARNWRSGQELPPTSGFVVREWEHRHLRRPPSGFHWVQIGREYLLVSEGTGMIFDVAPAY